MPQFIPADIFLKQLREDSEMEEIKSSVFHHPKRCGKLRNFTIRKGTGTNKYWIRYKRCYTHNVSICFCGYEIGMHYSSLSAPLNNWKTRQWTSSTQSSLPEDSQ